MEAQIGQLNVILSSLSPHNISSTTYRTERFNWHSEVLLHTRELTTHEVRHSPFSHSLCRHEGLGWRPLLTFRCAEGMCCAALPPNLANRQKLRGKAARVGSIIPVHSHAHHADSCMMLRPALSDVAAGLQQRAQGRRQTECVTRQPAGGQKNAAGPPQRRERRQRWQRTLPAAGAAAAPTPGHCSATLQSPHTAASNSATAVPVLIGATDLLQ